MASKCSVVIVMIHLLLAHRYSLQIYCSLLVTFVAISYSLHNSYTRYIIAISTRYVLLVTLLALHNIII